MFEFLKKDVLEENTRLACKIGSLEKELEEAHRQITSCKNIISSSAAPMFVVDRDLTINFINDAALEAMGYSRDEVVG
ncbi:MAG TPA: PAS domain-containing protein, partial [Dissulfurispiraceae bacterium]